MELYGVDRTCYIVIICTKSNETGEYVTMWNTHRAFAVQYRYTAIQSLKNNMLGKVH